MVSFVKLVFSKISALSSIITVRFLKPGLITYTVCSNCKLYNDFYLSTWSIEGLSSWLLTPVDYHLGFRAVTRSARIAEPFQANATGLYQYCILTSSLFSRSTDGALNGSFAHACRCAESRTFPSGHVFPHCPNSPPGALWLNEICLLHVSRNQLSTYGTAAGILKLLIRPPRTVSRTLCPVVLSR